MLDFYNQCVKDFKYDDIIKTYQHSLQLHNFKLIHTLGVKDYIFHDSEVDLKENTLLGHSHQQFMRNENGYTLVNPGSVGQNRAYINVANYVIWDLASGAFELKSLKFDINILLNEMKVQNYPDSCIEYYKNKKIAN
ncbi:Calcineurin-like phosphoesterase superfamily domain protein [compost metagenome]